MPRTEIKFFCDAEGSAPVVEWLAGLRVRDFEGWTRCHARIRLLAEMGHELRRPAADYLRAGIYELRAKHAHVQFRILYFFHGSNIAILAHSILKEDRVPVVEIERAIRRKAAYESNPQKHTYPAT